MLNHLLEPDLERIFSYCEHCGGEIYDGEDYFDIGGNPIHDDCFYDYMRELYADCKKEADCLEQCYFGRS